MKTIVTVTNEGVKREIDFQGDTLPDGRSIQGILDESEISKQLIKKLAEENETLKQQIEELNEEKSILARYVRDKSIRKILEWLLRIFAFIGAIGTIFWILSFLFL